MVSPARVGSSKREKNNDLNVGTSTNAGYDWVSEFALMKIILSVCLKIRFEISNFDDIEIEK